MQLYTDVEGEMVGLITFNHPFLHTERKIIPTLEFASDDL